MPTTPNYAIPYPDASSLVIDAPAQMQDLAETVDAELFAAVATVSASLYVVHFQTGFGTFAITPPDTIYVVGGAVCVTGQKGSVSYTLSGGNTFAAQTLAGADGQGAGVAAVTGMGLRRHTGLAAAATTVQFTPAGTINEGFTLVLGQRP